MRALSQFQASVKQCDRLIATAHKTGKSGKPLFGALGREQVTVAAFLNLFIAWERFLEQSIVHFMLGNPTRRGKRPKKYVSPNKMDDALKMIRGTNRFFDFAEPERVQALVRMFFKNGYPYDPHFTASLPDLHDLRHMRNWSAHINRNTQHNLEVVAQKIFSVARPGISLYDLLVAADPRAPAGWSVYAKYKTVLLIVAELIARG